MLKYHIARYEETDPQIAAKLAMSFYVDDLVCGTQDIEGCRKLYNSAKEYMKKAGFNFRWMLTLIMHFYILGYISKFT